MAHMPAAERDCTSIIPVIGEEVSLFAAGTGQPLSGCRLMIVEDQAIIAMDVQTALEEQGAVVVWAHSLEEARAFLQAPERLDAVLLDLGLGTENGLDLLGELDARHIPAILTSGYSGDGEKRLEGRPALKKPYTMSALVETLLTLQGEDGGR